MMLRPIYSQISIEISLFDLPKVARVVVEKSGSLVIREKFITWLNSICQTTVNKY
jgi:hypothetical protein